MKKVPVIFRILIFFMGYPLQMMLPLFRLPNFIIRKRLLENREKNENIKLKFPLNGQKKGELAEYRLGIKNFAHGGCGAIAVYNALGLTGREPDMKDIVTFLEEKGMNCYGLLGVNPTGICKYLTKQGIVWRRFRDAADAEREYRDGDCLISQYNWASKKSLGTHYVALARKDGVWHVYNIYNDCTEALRFRSLEEFLAHGEYCRPIMWILVQRTG